MPLVLVPGLLPHPLHPDPGVRPDLDRGRLGRRHRQLHRLHEVLGVPHEHLGGFLVLLGPCKINVRLDHCDCQCFIFLQPCAPSIVALTVERILSWVAMVGMRSHTWSKFCKKLEESLSHTIRVCLWRLRNIPFSFSCLCTPWPAPWPSW